jgi:DNA-binding response OmpR family regulator
VGTQPLVLVADDEPRITKLVSIALSEEGFRVVTASGGEDALAKAEEIRPDIVLLDIVMPDLDGIEVMRQLREQRPVPVILLTAKGATADKAKGLDLGADDYIAKPFSRAELVSRVRAILRRRDLDRAEGSGPLRQLGGLRLDFARHEVTADGEPVQLTPSEFKLLSLLAQRPGEVFSRAEIMRHLWGSDHVGDEHPADVHVSNLRRKIEASPGRPERVVTVRGAGYKLNVR